MNTDENTDPCSSVVSFCAVYADENPCRVAKDFRRSARRRMENPDASVKSPCPPCLRGETGRLAAAGSLSESRRSLRGVQDRECLMSSWLLTPCSLTVQRLRPPAARVQANPLLHSHCLAAGRLPAELPCDVMRLLIY